MPANRHHETTLAVAACLYAAVVIPLAIHKGGDLTSELGQSERLLHGLPPFGAADPNIGVPWPPFSAAVLIPFALIARVSLPLAKALWAAGSVACLWWCLRWAGRRAAGWRPALIALAAVAVPLQTNFEHLNIAAVLLALIVLATAELEGGRETGAGVAIGVAAALKAFPALLLLYCAAQRRWRALAVGSGVAVGLTLVALLPLGFSHVLSSARDWLLLGLGHRWMTQPTADQSLGALLSRLGGTEGVSLILGVLAVIVTLVTSAKRDSDTLMSIGTVTLVAVLLSPIAWVHSYVLLFPAWLAIIASGPFEPAPRFALLVAGIGTSGLLTVGPRALRGALLSHGAYTWSAILLWTVLVVALRSRPITPNPVSE